MTDWLKDAQPHYKEAFAKVGKKDWLGVKLLANGMFNLWINDAELKDVPELAANKIYRSANTSDLVIQYTISRMFAFGPKVFYPTFEQCEALEHVSVDIPLRDYQQIFEVVVIYFPKEYQEKCTKEFDYPCPRGVMCLRTKEGFVSYASMDIHPTANLVRTMSLENDTIKTVEDSIMQSEKRMHGAKKRISDKVRLHNLYVFIAYQQILIFCFVIILSESILPKKRLSFSIKPDQGSNVDYLRLRLSFNPK